MAKIYVLFNRNRQAAAKIRGGRIEWDQFNSDDPDQRFVLRTHQDGGFAILKAADETRAWSHANGNDNQKMNVVATNLNDSRQAFTTESQPGFGNLGGLTIKRANNNGFSLFGLDGSDCPVLKTDSHGTASEGEAWEFRHVGDK